MELRLEALDILHSVGVGDDVSVLGNDYARSLVVCGNGSIGIAVQIYYRGKHLFSRSHGGEKPCFLVGVKGIVRRVGRHVYIDGNSAAGWSAGDILIVILMTCRQQKHNCRQKRHKADNGDNEPCLGGLFHLFLRYIRHGRNSPALCGISHISALLGILRILLLRLCMTLLSLICRIGAVGNIAVVTVH